MYRANPLLNALGFFLRGIPVIFVRSDIALRSNNSMLHYLDFYRKCQKNQKYDHSFTDDLCTGYESFVAPLHEIRHFHDALLSRDLFQLFLLQNEKLWYAFQLIGNLTVGKDDLPLDLNSDSIKRRATAQASVVIDAMRESEARFAARHDELFREPDLLNGKPIYLSHLLETNAVVCELLNLRQVHGEAAAERYYRDKVIPLGACYPQYTMLLEYFTEVYGALTSAMATLYFIISYCLYQYDGHPVKVFCSMARESVTDRDRLLQRCGPQSLQKLFDKEAELEEAVNKVRLVNPLTRVALQPVYSDFINDLIDFPRSIYRCRKDLVTTYVNEWKYRADLYFEKLDKLPLPPLLFYPEEEEAAAGRSLGAYESDLKKRAIRYYMIRGQPEDTDLFVIAGLVDPAGLHASVSFDVADMHLLSEYCRWALFERKDKGRKDILYSTIVDEVYDKIFRKHFIKMDRV